MAPEPASNIRNDSGKRVLIVARNLRMGGIQKVVVNLSAALADEGHDVHILLYKDRIEFDLDPRVKVHVRDFDKLNRRTGIGLIYDLVTRGLLKPLVPKSGFLWKTVYYTPLFRIALKRLEREIGAPFDRLIFRGQSAYDVNWAFKDPRACFVVENVPTMLDGNDSRYKQAVDKLYYRLLWTGKRLVTVSNDLKHMVHEKSALSGAKPTGVSTIFTPWPTKSIRKLAEEPAPVPDEPYAIHVGRLVPQKNQALLLRAFSKSGIAGKLVIVGSGKSERSLKALTRKLGLEERVLFVGQKSNPYPWMKHGRLFILSSRIEGFGMVLAESLICGTPCVSTDCRAGVRDVLIEEQAEFITDIDEDALAEKIKEAWDSPPEVKPEWVKRFEAREIARQFVELDP